MQLDGNKLTAPAAKQLAKGKWPVLKSPDLSSNKLDDAAMFHFKLSWGQWPQFKELSLQHNNVTALGLELLMHSSWFLKELRLGRRAVSPHTWSLLSLDPDSMPKAASLSFMQNITLMQQRNEAATGQTKLWHCSISSELKRLMKMRKAGFTN